MKKVGIIGQSGRMGQELTAAFSEREGYQVGISYSKELAGEVSLSEVFIQNDIVVDFSNAALVEEILDAGIENPKPLVICTTGWDPVALKAKLDAFTAKAPLIIATNTSIGAAVQRYIVKKVAEVLGEEFDLDLHEKHHRFKVDSPSGTATTLLEDLIAAKKTSQNLQYEGYIVGQEARPERKIGVSVQRSGSIVGEHEVSFTSLEEQITIKHTAFDRALFAKGALKAVEWLAQEVAPGSYTIFDVLQLKD